MMNGENTSTGNQSGQWPARQPRIPSAAARKPIGIEPASPMKTLAGGKLNTRNAAAAAAMLAATTTNTASPASHAASAYAPKPNKAMPPASPSEPSMKL